MEKPKTMAEECRRCWSEIAAGTYYFNRGQCRVVPRNVQTIGAVEHLSVERSKVQRRRYSVNEYSQYGSIEAVGSYFCVQMRRR